MADPRTTPYPRDTGPSQNSPAAPRTARTTTPRPPTRVAVIGSIVRPLGPWRIALGAPPGRVSSTIVARAGGYAQRVARCLGAVCGHRAKRPALSSASSVMSAGALPTTVGSSAASAGRRSSPRLTRDVVDRERDDDDRTQTGPGRCWRKRQRVGWARSACLADVGFMIRHIASGAQAPAAANPDRGSRSSATGPASNDDHDEEPPIRRLTSWWFASGRPPPRPTVLRNPPRRTPPRK